MKTVKSKGYLSLIDIYVEINHPFQMKPDPIIGKNDVFSKKGSLRTKYRCGNKFPTDEIL